MNVNAGKGGGQSGQVISDFRTIENQERSSQPPFTHEFGHAVEIGILKTRFLIGVSDIDCLNHFSIPP
jgi:hypothetical protein